MQDDRRILGNIKKINLLKDLQRSELATIAEQSKVIELRRRRVVYMPGDPGHSVFGIAVGRVKISRVTPDGKELTIAYRFQGEIFGEICMLDGGSREEMAETTENSVLVEMPRELFEEPFAQHAELGIAMMRVLLERRRALERKVEDLVFKDVNSKLAELLLKLSQRYGVSEPRGTLLNIKVTHQEMANLIGSTRETVSLALAQFKRKKMITTESRRVIVTDPEALKALV